MSKQIKVISIIEPWASLIKENVKHIETRSWKTNYRGELYIHASLKQISRKDARKIELMELLDDKKLKYGCIIAKCNLIDCKLMDKELIEKIKKKNMTEYKCGEYKSGRYAWILDDIQMLDEPIEAKGKLNIWSFEI